MDNATKRPEQIHQLTISPEWEFTRSRTKDGATFGFHSSQMCPGYSIQVSNWRLRKIARAQGAPSEDIGDLILGVHKELKRVLGESAFEETNCVQSVMQKNAELQRAGLNLRESAGQSPELLIQADRWDIFSRKLMKAYLVRAAMEDLLLAPRVELLSFPLWTLTSFNKARYSIANAPWSFHKPPCRVEHLAKTGFNSGLTYGILAFAPNSEDIWIVSKFSQCEVELICNREAALKKEFPWFMDALKSAATKKPLVIFSENFKRVNCAEWLNAESRMRNRQALAILRRLFENWEKGNKPIPFAKLRPDKIIDRLGKELDAQKYPQTFALIVRETHEKTGERTARLSDDYEYKAK